ncbi:MAG: tetratricopeptide repeat protein [Magnetovibrionaceae bacterium]
MADHKNSAAGTEAEGEPEEAGPVAPDGVGLRNPFAVIAVSLVLTVLSWAMFLLALTGELEVWTYVSAQIAMSGLMALWVGVNYPRLGWSRSGSLLAIGLMFLGPFGALGHLYACSLFVIFSRNARPFEDWYLSLFPEDEKDSAQELYDEIVSGREGLDSRAGVVSFNDIMSFGTFEQKLAVLALISKHFRPDFAPVLIRALDDENAAIRVRAATAKAEIENADLVRSIELQGRLQTEPDSADAHFEMASFLDNQAYSGLLDEEQSDDNRRQALDHFELAFDLDRSKTGALLPIIRGHIRAGRTKKAADWIKRARKAGLEDARLDDWELECLFRLGRFSDLRRAAKRHYSLDPDNQKPSRMLGDVVRLWAAQAPLAMDGERP